MEGSVFPNGLTDIVACGFYGSAKGGFTVGTFHIDHVNGQPVSLMIGEMNEWNHADAPVK
ncbi:hypothetical protein [Phyllobacterium sp. UNC302MFCol5.2]|uniref:hypothetical protein n=1 Tax=Phyllobacterium sp. UNC302MFCol5.2 TaxID=1449065 RepID=UPI0004803D0C|nr:hypothetical protein [Phyllobacterium sp. UNC302MFCol5.2]